ncbi:MAG: UDP-N-acetylmuramoyl-L-alanine--D-glutamate ligase [Clostridiales bacterium]|nr:UDP-N-acetylmuramoyl-L-alanine--D-glutamate ligase [Clostridiales bacterium]
MPPFNPEAVKQYAGKTVLVAGAARSGLAATQLLLALGARVLLHDDKPLTAFDSLPQELLRHERLELLLGQPALPLLARAQVLLISPGIPVDSPLVLAAREAGLPVTGELAFAAGCATQRLLAVSGTNGKTTTVSLLGEIFNQAGLVAQVAGNIGYPLSAAVLRAREEEVLIVEVSSFQLETADGFRPQAAAMLNITPDHLDRHHSMDTYIALKRSLFVAQRPGDITVLNADDPQVAALAPGLPAQVTWFSSSGAIPEGAVLQDGQIIWREAGQDRVLCAARDLKIPGHHNYGNALAATALAVRWGIPLPVIAYALKNFAGVEHRIEFTARVNQVVWLNDSKGTNPESTMRAVEAMDRPTVLIAGGYDKQLPFDALAATVVQSGLIHQVVLLGQTAPTIEAALRGAGYDAISHADSLEDAVHQAHRLARPGGCVLFSPACSSFDMFENYEQRGQVFKQLVQRLGQGEG